jgi:hypothetical protein
VSLGAGETVNSKLAFEEWLWEAAREHGLRLRSLLKPVRKTSRLSLLAVLALNIKMLKLRERSRL